MGRPAAAKICRAGNNEIAHMKAINAERGNNDLAIVSVYNERQALRNS
jgi:hypothetical protein